MVETLSELLENATLIVIWLVVCLVGLGGCKSNLVKETCIDKPVWTTVVAKDCYTETVNQQTHTVYELTLIADGRDNQDFDNSEQIKEELDKLEAAGLGRTKNAETLRTILESKKYKSALGPEKLDLPGGLFIYKNIRRQSQTNRQ